MKQIFVHVAIIATCLAVVGVGMSVATTKQKNDRYIHIVGRSD